MLSGNGMSAGPGPLARAVRPDGHVAVVVMHAMENSNHVKDAAYQKLQQ